ncbi:hypothetical protein QR680_004408 [Steinernema hermaphroditum]|uniref:ELM2 domain-containing protein n=1 Tax=Steinernema hermaphroditum TaxID=289476 RepID=A0AA39HPQ0_9BILA|nr:hypothetical protein QR680_004408 [Steinernema hermaphroditum]
MPPRLQKLQNGKKSSSPESDEEKPSVSRFLQMKRTLSDDGKLIKEEIRTSRVGCSYQAELPEYVGKRHLKPRNRLNETLWIPEATENNILALYGTIGTERKYPLYDDEQVLHALYSSGYRIPEAVELLDEDVSINSPRRTVTVPRKKMTLEEVESFEEGIVNLGKNFFKIRNGYLPLRTTGELIEFYYFWKNSSRYDRLVDRLAESIDIMDGEIMKLTDLKKPRK